MTSPARSTSVRQRPSRRARLFRSRAYRRLLRLLTPDMLSVQSTPRSDSRFANLPLSCEVVVYFPDDATKVYQLEQWLPVLEDLHARHALLIITRNLGCFRALQSRTRLPLLYTRRLRDLNDALVSADPGVCLYVNNSATNFQTLGWPRALHLHLNHGESDKISMATNQAKAYDQVLVAGPAAVQRYLDNLLALDAGKLVQVGRPQLDLRFPDALAPSTRTTVLYAPTWEGETPAMDYSSLGVYGVPLVEQLVADGGFRVVYKPHPKVLTGSPGVRQAHARIVALLTDPAAGREDDPHVVELRQSILALFSRCDLLVSDVSSVALDWLYLRTDRPLWLADPRSDRSALEHASPLASRTYVLDDALLPQAAAGLHESVVVDPLAAERVEARAYYFGDLQIGESTRRFLETVDAAVARRGALLAERRREHHEFEMTAGTS